MSWCHFLSCAAGFVLAHNAFDTHGIINHYHHCSLVHSPSPIAGPLAPAARYKVAFRLLAAVPPLIGACLFRDLKTVLDYAGCTGIILAFFFPAMLQVHVHRCNN